MNGEAVASGTALIAERLAAEQGRFRAFLVSRLGNAADAEDFLQQNLLSILRRGAAPRDEERVIAWFYRVLHRALIDQARSETARRVRDDRWSRENRAASADPEFERTVCSCVRQLVESLPASAAEIVRRIDLQEESIAAVAESLAITPNAATVRLHRARRALRSKLEQFCGTCAGEKCRDCKCPPADASR